MGEEEPAAGRARLPLPLAVTPVAALWASLLGLGLVCLGVVVDVYRHEHGAAAGELISASNPGVLVALAGFVMVATGLLAAFSILLFQSAGSPRAVMLRGVAVVVAWASVTAAAAGAVTYAATAGVTIGHDGRTAVPPTATPSNGGIKQSEAPGAEQRASFRGVLTLDGAPLDAPFLGVRVTRDGLSTACQYTIPAITQGRYEIKVLADAELRGCGAPGAEVLLWTFTKNRFIYSSTSAPWPGSGATATFDASFSSAAPEGASKPVTEFKGTVRDRGGAPLPGGTVIETYVGEVRCGVTSLRHGSDAEVLYTLIVAGPESVPGCARDAPLTFRINGAPAAQTAVNDLPREENGHVLNLTVA